MTRWTTLGAVLAFGMVTLTPHPAHGMDDNDKAALAALLAVGVGVAAVASDKKDKHKNDWDHDRFGEPFSPAPGITCMPKVRQCYDGAMLSDTWTERVFGLGGSWASQHVSWGGSFKKSCGDIRTDDAGNLRAKCLDERGRRRDAYLAEDNCRSHRAGNDNGRLVCEGGNFGGSGGSFDGGLVKWRGSFQKSCRDIQVDGSGNLRASCQNSNGRWERAFLAERDCRRHKAGNQNGRLVCES